MTPASSSWAFLYVRPSLEGSFVLVIPWCALGQTAGVRGRTVNCNRVFHYIQECLICWEYVQPPRSVSLSSKKPKRRPTTHCHQPPSPSLAAAHSFGATRSCALYSCLWQFDQEAQTPSSPLNLPRRLVPSHCPVPSVTSFLNISFTLLL